MSILFDSIEWNFDTSDQLLGKVVMLVKDWEGENIVNGEKSLQDYYSPSCFFIGDTHVNVDKHGVFAVRASEDNNKITIIVFKNGEKIHEESVSKEKLYIEDIQSFDNSDEIIIQPAYDFK